MACDTCYGIASDSKGSPTDKQERSVFVNYGPLQKSAADGCLSCSLIQGIVKAGKTTESNVGFVEVGVDKEACLYVYIQCIPTDDSIGTVELCYPFTDQGNTI